jgi:transcriptional pleiotropic repressor
MNTLLEKTRNINKLLQKSAGNPVDFEEMAQVLKDQINANCYIISRQGKILGYSVLEDFDCEIMSNTLEVGAFPEEYNDELLRIVETKANFSQNDINHFRI